MVAVRKYRLSVHTGDRSNAGTNANVYIKMIGSKGGSGKRMLKKSRNNNNKFEQGQVRVTSHVQVVVVVDANT